MFPDCRCKPPATPAACPMAQALWVLALGCSAQTWDVNALSRCNSKFRITSSKDLPAGALEGLKTQAHSEQPQQRLSSIQMSLRVAAITGARQNLGSGYFVPFSCPPLLEHAASFRALKWPSAGIGATCCFDRLQSKSSAQRVWVPPCTFGGKHAQTADESAPRLTDASDSAPSISWFRAVCPKLPFSYCVQF